MGCYATAGFEPDTCSRSGTTLKCYTNNSSVQCRDNDECSYNWGKAECTNDIAGRSDYKCRLEGGYCNCKS